MSKRDPLDSKRRRTEPFRFEVEDPTAAAEALAEAEAESRLASLRGEKDPAVAAAAKQRLDGARAALDACFGTVTLRALPTRVQLLFEQEIAERDSDQEKAHLAAVKAAEAAGQDPPEPKPVESKWDEDSYEVRLIAACDADGRSPLRWAQILDLDGDWTLDDRNALLRACYEVNQRRLFDPAVLGKGWAAKRS